MRKTHTVRISSGDIEPVDVAIDYPLEIGKPMVFSIEQELDRSLITTVEMLEEILEAMKQIEREWRS